MDPGGDRTGQLVVDFQARGNLASVGEALDPVEMIMATILEVALEDPLVEVVPSIEALRRPLLLPFYQRRRACSCFNITTTKSRVQGGQAL